MSKQTKIIVNARKKVKYDFRPARVSFQLNLYYITLISKSLTLTPIHFYIHVLVFYISTLYLQVNAKQKKVKKISQI